MSDDVTTREWAERWLSAARLEAYLRAASGDVDAALELHEWNLALGRAIMADLSHFELALRNAYVRVLSERWGDDWLFDDASPVRRPIMRKSKAGKMRDVNLVNRRAISDAMSRAHDPSDSNQVIAGLMLGFWIHMTDRSRERDLWIPCLHTAWPTGTDRARLHPKLFSIARIRNRIAHNERLFSLDDGLLLLASIDADILMLMGQLCPEAYEMLYGKREKTTVELFLEERPAPVGFGYENSQNQAVRFPRIIH